MAERVTEWFDTVMNLAGKFVEGQRGVWDNTAWMDFIAGLQKQGIELTDTMKNYTGSLLESMKKVYETTMETRRMERSISDISELAVSFMKTSKGIWDQMGWESFLKDLQKKGIALTDETRNYLGAVLAAARDLYTLRPTVGKEAAAEKKGVE